MDSISVYSKGGDYFLLEDIGGYLSRVPLHKGRYKGTLEVLDYPFDPSWTYAPLDQYTLHSEYCNVAWLQKNYGYYELVLYDKKVVTDRFLGNAITSMEEIQKAVFTQYRGVHFERLLIVGLYGNGARHISMFNTYNLYKRLLEG